ncbi:MAG: S-layer homology domain-containing protein [Clostridiales bacterium]|jgi:hypothetical protein|nr:S-layer homology domain-containing protein [Clostridiales bacterium]
MKTLKRMTSFVIACAMVLGLTAAVTHGAELPPDVAGTKYEEPAALLKALEIMVGDAEDGAFRLEDGILRSEFAKIAVYLSGLSEVAEASSVSAQFPDVVAGHWATGYISVAAQQGYVIGDDTGTFRPDDHITYAEAVTVIVRILGYEPSAVSNGGFPTGYTVVAGQIGLLKNGVIATGADAAVTRGTVAIMAYNALTIDMMEKTSYGANESYEVVDKQILTEKLDVTKMYGQVVANSKTNLTGTSTLRKDEVNIKTDGGDTVTYRTGTTDAADYLARNVIYYVYQESENTDAVLILVRNNTNKDEITTVAASDIDRLTGDAGQRKTLYYWLNKETDRKPLEITIKQDATVFYNGVANPGYDLANLNTLKSGNVTLVDSARTDEIGYVFVTEYQNIVVDDVSAASHRVTDKYNLLSLTLDPADRNIQFSITKDGKAIGLTDIAEWNILSVAMDQPRLENATVIDVRVSTQTVTGKITEIDDERVLINGTFYEVAYNYTEAGQPALVLETEGTFYLDVEGKIAAVDTTAVAGSNYAYLVAAETTGSIDNVLQLELFGRNGETVVMDAATKVRVNTVSNLTSEAALTAIKTANGGNVPQLITYEVNADGKIYYIDTAEANGTGKAMKTAFSKDYVSGEGGLEYKSASRKLGAFNVSADTVVFDIPEGDDDTDNYAVRTMAMFVDKTSYDVEIYDLTDDLTAKVVIVKNSSGNTNAESPIAVVTKLSSAQNADRVTVGKLYAIENGEAVELLAKDASTLVKADGGATDTTPLTAGDIIQYTKNARGEIDKVKVLFDARTRGSADALLYEAHTGTEMETVLGRVSGKFSASVNVIANNMSETNFNLEKAIVYNYDFTKPTGSQVTVADASYITKYDDGDARRVFLRLYKGEVAEVVIIKE